MRNTKIISALVALVLSLSIVGFVGSPAQAAKPKHDLSSVTGGKTSKGQLFITGKVSTLPDKKVLIQRKLKGQGFAPYKEGPTNDKGKFKVNVDGPIGTCFKIIAPRTKDYRKTVRKGPEFCIVSV